MTQTLEQQNKYTLGKFEIILASRGITVNIYSFKVECFEDMNSRLQLLVGGKEALRNAIVEYHGGIVDHKVIPIYNEKGICDGNYHIEDCTVQHFKDNNSNRCMILIMNKSADKRENAFKVLEEIFA